MFKLESDRILFAADMAGTLLFAIEGATAAISGNLDLLGLMVLAFATAVGGGIVFFLHHFVQAIPPNIIMVLDAAGLTFFAIAGTEKALLHNLHPFIAVLLGTVTAVGGGTIRDLFLARTPRVLEADVYATAALVGSVVMILMRKVRLSPAPAAFSGGVVCFLLRVVSVWENWNLPKVRGN